MDGSTVLSEKKRKKKKKKKKEKKTGKRFQASD